MEKQTVFIKRYPSKGEFPKEDVFAVLTKNGKMFGFDVTERTEWWLEEIELPGDEEIRKFINEQPYYGACNHEYHEGIEEGANFIINHLKSNKNGN